MKEQAKKYLFDIQSAITSIEQFVGKMNFTEYEADLKTKSAVERQLGIIGEAVNKYQKIQSNSELTNAKEIVNFRNRIIHAFDNIDDTIIWVIINKHPSILKQEVNTLLG